jgi:hypothetical protein
VPETGINKAPVAVLYSCARAAQLNVPFLVRTRVDAAGGDDSAEAARNRADRSVYDMHPLEGLLTAAAYVHGAS